MCEIQRTHLHVACCLLSLQAHTRSYTKLYVCDYFFFFSILGTELTHCRLSTHSATYRRTFTMDPLFALMKHAKRAKRTKCIRARDAAGALLHTSTCSMHAHNVGKYIYIYYIYSMQLHSPGPTNARIIILYYIISRRRTWPGVVEGMPVDNNNRCASVALFLIGKWVNSRPCILWIKLVRFLRGETSQRAYFIDQSSD